MGARRFGFRLAPEHTPRRCRRFCALVGDDVGLQTADGWQATIDVYATAGLLDRPIAPADVMPRSR